MPGEGDYEVLLGEDVLLVVVDSEEDRSTNSSMQRSSRRWNRVKLFGIVGLLVLIIMESLGSWGLLGKVLSPRHTKVVWRGLFMATVIVSLICGAVCNLRSLCPPPRQRRFP
jgi:hypothetical protein